MKTLIVITLLAAGMIRLPAQNSMPRQANVPPTAYHVMEQGANYNIWQRETYEKLPNGKIVSHIHKYTELGTSLNYTDNGKWKPSREQIDILPDGTASATQGRHKAYFPIDIYNGIVKLVTPDGKVLQSQPTAIICDDGSNTILIAVITNSVGQLVSSNQVIYRNAFVGIAADMLYTYTKAGLEQNVIIREEPPSPESIGLNPQKTKLQVLTEFLNSPESTLTNVSGASARQSNSQDEDLVYGAMNMVHGKAFLTGNVANRLNTSNSVAVHKRWLHFQNRSFLVEEVSLEKFTKQLKQLPLRISRAVSFTNSNWQETIAAYALQRVRPMQTTANRISLAINEPSSRPEAVIDYTIVDSGGDYTFADGSTYLITGPVYFDSVNMEGGATIKFDYSADDCIYAPINCTTSPYHPSVFTTMDDDSAGEVGLWIEREYSTNLDNGSITLAENYPNPPQSHGQIYLNGPSQNVQYLVMKYAGCAIHVMDDYCSMTDCQFFACDTAVTATPIDAYNTLFVNCGTALSDEAVPGVRVVENVTADRCGTFIDMENNGDNSICITNSIFTAVTNPFTSDVPVYTADTYFITNNAGIYDTYHYLATNSPYRQAGTTNIDPTLLKEIRLKTTYAPYQFFHLVLGIGNYISSNLDLYPTPIEDTNLSAVDIGYHYDPVDYDFYGNIFGSNITINVNAGTVIGSYGGLTIGDNASLSCIGRAEYPVRIVDDAAVVEAPAGYSSLSQSSSAFIISDNGNTNTSLSFRFVKMSPLKKVTTFSLAGESVSPISFLSSEFEGCIIHSTYPSMVFTNCLFYGSSIHVYPQDSFVPVFQNCSLVFGEFGCGTTNGAAVVKDTLFDSMGIFSSSFFYDAGHNAYVTNFDSLQTYLDTNDTGDIILSNSLSYQVGPLGDYYQLTDSPLLNNGDTNASVLGLFHYTVLTNQVIEGTNIVSIGYHYVATGQYGDPLDSNGDGLPDYIQDANGNGFVDTNETAWALPPTITITSPLSGTTCLTTNDILTINVNALASAGTYITEVKYCYDLHPENDPLIGISAASPYSMNWTNADWTNTFGPYDITAIATDNTGVSATNVASSVSIELDSDGDGIPDWWMIYYFGHPDGETNDDSLAEDDANSDGFSNLEEYENNTDPTELPNLAVINGNDQAGNFSEFLPTPITVQATDFFGNPWTNSLLTFTITNGTALIAATTNDTAGAYLKEKTDTNGLATVFIYFPPANSNPPDSTILASVSAGLSTNAIIINEYVPLAHWRFDATNSWIGEEGQLPLLTDNLAGIPSWSSNALVINNLDPVMIAYRIAETNGNLNFNCQTGSVVFYFKPDWDSVDSGGSGPGDSGRLIEIGSYNPAFTNGWWSLYLSPDGNDLIFATSTNGSGTTNLVAYAPMISNEWYQIALTYSADGSSLYVDGQLETSGAGVTYFPNADELTNGFRIGSDENGGNQAEGAFDEMETFADPLTGLPNSSETYWLGISDYKADPNGTLAAWELAYFGSLGLDPNGDYDGDGIDNQQEFLDGTDPNTIGFSFSFQNQYVNTNILIGRVNLFGGVPSYGAIMIGSTNFSSASWMPYTSSNITVNLGTNFGICDIWIGLRGLPTSAQQTWQETTVIFETNTPSITITNPIDNSSMNSARVNVSGTFSTTAFKQITVNGILAFVNGTNFEALNVPLVGGTNIITTAIQDLIGASNTASIDIVGQTNSDGSLNEPVLLQATPLAGFVPLSVNFSVQTNFPGIMQQVSYDFNGDDIIDFITNNLDLFTYTYATNGEFFPVVTVQTTVGRFSSVGGWNSMVSDSTNQPVKINVLSALTQSMFASITDPVALKWTGSNLYVLSGSTATITEFDTNADIVSTLDNLGTNPTGFDVDTNGNVYVAIVSSNQVWKFDFTGSSYVADTNFGFGGFIGTTNGMAGATNGQFNAPFDVVVSPDGGTISVSDSGNNQIQQFFAANGSFIGSFGTNGTGIGQFNTPKGLAYDAAGNLYIVDAGNNRIAVTGGTNVDEATGEYGTTLGQLNNPVNINVGARGVYIADTSNNRIQSFIPAIPFTVSPDSTRYAVAGFNQPAAVAAIGTYTNEEFYVADTGNNRIILCNMPNNDINTIQSVWGNMTLHIANGDINGAIPFFSIASQDDYRQSFLSLGTANIASVINQIGTLTPSYIDDEKAEFYFTNSINGQIVTFPVKFDLENGVWKVLEF